MMFCALCVICSTLLLTHCSGCDATGWLVDPTKATREKLNNFCADPHLRALCKSLVQYEQTEI